MIHITIKQTSEDGLEIGVFKDEEATETELFWADEFLAAVEDQSESHDYRPVSPTELN